MWVYTEGKQIFDGLIKNVSPSISCLSLQLSDPMRWKKEFLNTAQAERESIFPPSQSIFRVESSMRRAYFSCTMHTSVNLAEDDPGVRIGYPNPARWKMKQRI
jgi:hypothetical protein